MFFILILLCTLQIDFLVKYDLLHKKKNKSDLF